MPVAAQAAPVDLGTVTPFVVLGGSSVTNTGPSVLNGDLGLSPGTSLSGFGLPAVVNGTTHVADGVAAQAQADLTTAYGVAAGQPVPPANDLTGQDLGGLVLVPGAYSYATSAQLTGALTLDAQGDPDAQFVFEIGATLTTAGASSVLLFNGASACNVYWQVGSSATIGTTTAFNGNLMALNDISLNNAATVVGRVLALNGQVSLINNVLDATGCAASVPTPTPTPLPPAGDTTTGDTTTGTGTAPTGTGDTGGGAPIATTAGTARFRRTARVDAPQAACASGFSARVRGHLIKKVVFTIDGRHASTRRNGLFTVTVRAMRTGVHTVRARVTFKDATRAKTLSLPYRCVRPRF